VVAFSLRYKDRLEIPSNFILWKCRVHMLLEEHDLWDFVGTKVPTSFCGSVGYICCWRSMIFGISWGPRL
jgi:hypothetical protein